MYDKVKVIRRNDTRSFLEGAEYCREYISTDKLTFGTSTLLSGQKGNVDKGHPEAHEVFFVVQGTVLVHFPDSNEYVELGEYDLVFIPPSKPHEIINIGEGKAIISWSCAPKP